MQLKEGKKKKSTVLFAENEVSVSLCEKEKEKEMPFPYEQNT